MWRYVVTFIALLGLVGSCGVPEETDPFTADCRAWCSKRGDCGFVADTDLIVERCTDSCVDAMELDAPKFGQECVESYERAMNCLAEISCDEYAALDKVPATERPCAETLGPFYEQCPGVFLAPEAPKEESP